MVRVLEGEARLLLGRVQRILDLLGDVEAASPSSRIVGSDAESISNDVTAQIDTAGVDAAMDAVDVYHEANSQVLWRVLDGSEEMKTGRFLSKLRNAVKAAMGMSAANSDVEGTIKVSDAMATVTP